MKFIKLTSATMKGKSVYINVEHIGDFFEYEEGTSIGVTTHNNGGFKVKETVEEVLIKINNFNNLKINQLWVAILQE